MQLAAGLEDVRYAVELGLRSVLVADLGLLAVLGDLVRAAARAQRGSPLPPLSSADLMDVRVTVCVCMCVYVCVRACVCACVCVHRSWARKRQASCPTTW
jgi:hypothetical protein